MPSLDQAFVDGSVDTPVGLVPRVPTLLTKADRLGGWRVRWGIGRDSYAIDPGLYAVGAPDDDSPVLVTANYKLTFDALRCHLAGSDAWVLSLDTRGINVWCAAGKKTFSTDELVRRVEYAGLDRIVGHRRLVLPQLGASGVAAREVAERCGFRVVYGPVRAADVRRFLEAGMKATPDMREVTFTTAERLVLTPVELVGVRKYAAWVAVAALALSALQTRPFSTSGVLLGALGNAAPFIAGLIAGAVVTPLLLPWIPGRLFAVKGALVGAATAAVMWLALHFTIGIGWRGTAAMLLATVAVSSYLAMNFTGSTPFTSPSGVEYEMRLALPWQAGAGLGLVALLIVSAVIH